MSEIILIVDDEPAQLQMVEQAVQNKLKYHTVTAAGGQEALQLALGGKQPQPDLILLDLVMPGMDGLQVIREVRVQKPNLPIIVMVQYGDDENALRAVEAGADDFLIKPVNLERLRISIRHLFRIQRLNSIIALLERMVKQGDLQAAGNGSAPLQSEYSAMQDMPAMLDTNGHIRKLKSIEKEAICFALRHSGGCMTRAARSLGIGRSTLYRRVHELTLDGQISRANQTTRPMIKVSSIERS